MKLSSLIREKKGQLKIQQMAIMLVAITLFFVMVFMFYVTIRMGSLREEAEQLNKEQTIGLITKITGSPEFNFAGASRGIDADKAMVLKNKEEYSDFWDIDGVIIKKLYPPASDIECTTANYPNCTTITLFTDGQGEFIESYVALCKKVPVESRTYDKCELALIRLMIEDIGNE